MTLKQTVREQAVPFRSCDPFFSAANISHLEKSQLKLMQEKPR